MKSHGSNPRARHEARGRHAMLERAERQAAGRAPARETCGGCGGRIVRIVPRNMPLVFGQVAYSHVDTVGCPGRPSTGAG